MLELNDKIYFNSENYVDNEIKDLSYEEAWTKDKELIFNIILNY